MTAGMSTPNRADQKRRVQVKQQPGVLEMSADHGQRRFAVKHERHCERASIGPYLGDRKLQLPRGRAHPHNSKTSRRVHGSS
jgi:hypothetical protein